jgi:hypothetical protein
MVSLWWWPSLAPRSANASKEASYGEAHLRQLAEQSVATVADTNAAEDDLFAPRSRGIRCRGVG